MNQPYPWLDPERHALNQALDDQRLGHAPMFLGSPGVGKRALADWLVRRILCLQPVEGEPCGECHACTLIANATHPDLFRLALLEDKSEILVDQVREFIASLSLTPSIGDRRIGLIVPADRLNRNAANALLKTLEEPSGEVWLVLVTDNEDKLPVTVTSRCQRRYVPVPDPATAMDWLTKRHGDRADRDCQLALELADGAPLLADAWLSGAGKPCIGQQGRAVGQLQGQLAVPISPVAVPFGQPVHRRGRVRYRHIAPLAAAGHGHRQLVLVVGHQHQPDFAGRFFQRFQKRVGRIPVEPIGRHDQTNAAVAYGRRQRKRSDELAYLVDEDFALVFQQRESKQIRMRRVGNQRAGMTFAAGFSFDRLQAQDAPNQPVGQRALAYAGRAQKHRRMAQPLVVQRLVQRMALRIKPRVRLIHAGTLIPDALPGFRGWPPRPGRYPGWHRPRRIAPGVPAHAPGRPAARAPGTSCARLRIDPGRLCAA